jgi:membrane protein involved in colicin uptake
MNPLLIKYSLIAVAFIGWTSAVAWTVADYKDAKWKAAYAAQESIAHNLLNNAYAEKAAAEKAASEKAREVDEQHAKDMAAAHAGNDEYDRKLRIALSRARGCSASGGQAPNSSVSENPPGGGDSGSGSPDFDAGRRLRNYALELQAYARACHSWAVSVGR